ncbi:MAG: type II secretion system F family protein [Candidatus Hydrothermarchaeaceae archaeon]
MAESRKSQVLRKIRVPKFLVPPGVQRELEVLLANANIAFSASEWISIFAFVGFVLFIVASLLISPLIGLGIFASTLAAMFVYPKVQADKRRARIEETLPDALHHMSVAIRTGLVLESVIKEVSESEYGPLSDEFAQIVVEMRRGRSLKDALNGFSKRAGSKEVQRAMRLLLEGVEFGGPISDVLDEVSEDMRAVRVIQRERKTMTSQQISFLAMASLMAGPFVMGVVASIPQIMTEMAGGIGGAASFPLEEIGKVVTALSFYVVGQAMSGSVMMAVVMYGNFKKGFKFMIPMGLVAYIVYFGVKTVMPKAITMF